MRNHLRPLVAAMCALGVGMAPPMSSKASTKADSLAAELARVLPGTWRMEALGAGGQSRPTGTRTFTPAFGDGVLLQWEERDVIGAVRSRGFLGARDSTATQMFYVSVAPNMPPVAVTGHPDARTRSIAWSLTPAVAPDHPYNRELVVSRIDLLGPTAFDWIAPGHWHIRFRKTT